MFETLTTSPSLSTPSKAFSVTEINTMVSDVLAAGLPSYLWIEGEISNLSVAASGHRYLSLKDDGSTISCALFKGSANRISRDILSNLKNGDKVVVKASLSVYKPRGNYQLIISDIEPVGFGALAKAFAALKAKLEREGLTADIHKKPLPTWPQQIALVTSDGGAAIKDVLTTLKRRAPFLSVSVYPTMVQGDKAAYQIIQALKKANHPDAHNDVILLVRGGGSLEDLQAFNDEDLAYKVFNSRLPIVTGVGHETDFAIVDFVSDYRAATPTAAAEIISPDKETLNKQLLAYQHRLASVMQGYQQQSKNQLNHYTQRLSIQHPQRQLQQQSQRLDELMLRMQRQIQRQLLFNKNRFTQLHRQLRQHSPLQRLNQWQLDTASRRKKLQQTMQLRVDKQQQLLDVMQQRLQVVHTNYQQQKQRLLGLQARLQLLSPLGILDRGYALVFDSKGQLVKQASEVNQGEQVSIRFVDGYRSATVKE